MSFPRERIAVTLKTLNSTQDSIKGASRLIKQYNDQASEVAKIFLDEIKKAPNENKLLIIYVLHEIMLETKDRHFVMAFGDISRALFTDVADAINDKTVLNRFLKILTVWEKEYLFKKEFIQKLSNIIHHKINVLDGIAPIDSPVQEEKPDTSANRQRTYSKSFMRDYNNVKDNPMAREYYDRKILESNYSKYEEKIRQIGELVKESERNRNDPTVRENLREALQFLRKAQDQYTQLLTSTTDYMCTLSKKLEDDTKKYINTSYERYEMFEKQLQKRKESFD